MKNKLVYIALAIFVLIIAILLVNYANTPKPGSFIQLDYKKVVKKVEDKDSFILVVSKSTCSHCASYKPKIETIVKEYGIDVYYIDFDDEDENTQKEFLDKFDLDGSTPITLFFKKGSEVSVLNRIEGDLPEEKVISTFKKMGFIED